MEVRGRPECEGAEMEIANLFAGLPRHSTSEEFTTLLESRDFRLERIVSCGQPTPPGQWYDQDRDEWVVLLAGSAGLCYENEQPVQLGPGDWLHIPAHRRHRVEWTDPDRPTVWLALHFVDGSASAGPSQSQGTRKI